MAILVRRGNEADFDPSKMLPGEWAVSLDTKYVRMCFSPGVCLRMATYEAFEADMEQIKALLAEAESIEEAVAKIQTEINDTAVVVEDYAILSQSYAVGGTGTREGENADNAKYYYEQAKHISQGGNGLVPMGTIAFEDIPTTDIVTNAMYNISNDFTSDERFVDGGGVLYGKGSNIFYTVEGLWDVLAASDVKGVKGAAEDIYRQGNVNITPENVGAVAVGGDTADNIVEFTSSDLSEPTEWTDVAVLASGEKHSTILNKISKIFKNVRYMYKMLGTTDISSISDGTISGVLAFLKNEIKDVNSNLANTSEIIGYGTTNQMVEISVSNIDKYKQICVVPKFTNTYMACYTYPVEIMKTHNTFHFGLDNDTNRGNINLKSNNAILNVWCNSGVESCTIYGVR